MAHESMKFTHAAVSGSVEILKNSEYVGHAVTLDTAAFADGVCKAGSVIDKDGKLANSASALGVLLHDVPQTRPQATLVVGGYINEKVAKDHSGVTVSDEAKTAMKNVLFL